MSIFYYQIKENQNQATWHVGEESKRAEICSTIAFHATPYSLSAEPGEGVTVRYDGDFWGDIDGTVTESILAIQRIKKALETLAVDINTVELFATGGRGFHFRIPMKLFGGIPYPVLPKIHKYVAKQLDDLADVNLDKKLYNMGKTHPLRVENKQRSNGYYKVQISWSELEDMTELSYFEICKAPREKQTIPVPENSNQNFINFWHEANSHIRHAEDALKNSPEISDEVLAALQGGQPNCVAILVSGGLGGSGLSNDIAQTAARCIETFGTDGGIIDELCENNATDSTSSSELKSHIEAAQKSVTGSEWSCGYMRVLPNFNTPSTCKNCPIAKAVEATLLPTEDERGDFCFEVYDQWTGSLPPGVHWFGKDSKYAHLSGILKVTASTSDEHGNDSGRLLEFYDHEKKIFKRWDMPAELIGDSRILFAELRKRGLWITDLKVQSKLVSYLNDRKTAPQQFTKTNKTGWFKDSFVLPHKTIGNQSYIFSSQLAETSLYSQKGTLEDWKREVARLAINNPMLTLALSMAFAGALQKLAGQSEGGGFHIYGASSIGKSTTLYSASSVWGGREYVNDWKSTSNGIEARAEQYNDSLMPMDEISQGKAKDIEEALYMLANGKGKTRADQKGNARKARTWQILALSNGEFSIEDSLKEAGLSPKAGQELRLANLPVFGKFGAFDDLHEFSSGKEFVEHIDTATKKFFGVAGVEWITKLVEFSPPAKDLLREKERELLQNLGVELNSQQQRVLRRFALIAVAGELATEYGITGWEVGEATKGIQVCASAWVRVKGGSGSIESRKAIEAVRSFIELHGESRFRDITKTSSGFDQLHDNRTIYNQAGFMEYVYKFKNSEDTELDPNAPFEPGVVVSRPVIYYFNTATMKQILGSFEQDLKMLKDVGALITKGDKHSTVKWIEGKNERVYAIFFDALGKCD